MWLVAPGGVDALPVPIARSGQWAPDGPTSLGAVPAALVLYLGRDPSVLPRPSWPHFCVTPGPAQAKAAFWGSKVEAFFFGMAAIVDEVASKFQGIRDE